MPEWLHSRPKKSVKHCLEKMELAKEVNTKNVFRSEGLKMFTGTSSANPEKFYEVFLGNDLKIPSCQHFEWKRKLMPCKHILAVINEIKRGWNSLSSKYRDSVFLNTDYEVIGITNNEVTDSSVTIENQKVESPDTNYYEDSNGDDGNGISEFSQILTKTYPKRTRGTSCREQLQQIKSLMYLVSDKEPLENLHKQLNIILDELNRSTTTDFGLVINTPEIMKIKDHRQFKSEKINPQLEELVLQMKLAREPK